MSIITNASRIVSRHQKLSLLLVILMAFACIPDGLLLLVIGVIAAVGFGPIALDMRSMLDEKAQLAYLKGFFKTARAQRTAIVILSFFLVSILRRLAAGWLDVGSLRHFNLAFMVFPPLIYLSAIVLSFSAKLCVRATRRDPDLIAQRQLWSGSAFSLFMLAFPLSIASVVMSPQGPVKWLSDWLIQSGNDADFVALDQWFPGYWGGGVGAIGPVDAMFSPPQVQDFETFVAGATFVVVLLLLFEPAVKLASFLTSFCWRLVSLCSLENISEAFLETLRLPGRTLRFRHAHPFLLNASRSFWYLCACYLALLWLFGMSGGAIGRQIVGWMDCSLLDAGFRGLNSGLDVNLRIFLGSIVALYATVPFAIMSAVFLPCAKPRSIVINADGISLTQGPYLSLWFRPVRLWSDLKSVSVPGFEHLIDLKRARLVLKFRSGGALKTSVSQCSAEDLRVLLNAIDEHSPECAVSDEALVVVSSLIDSASARPASDGLIAGAIRSTPVEEFKSQIFVPFEKGEFLPDGETRIVKQLAAKPLCAVYLARQKCGKLAVVKQFCLAEDNDETRAMAKIFEREYELLSRLDHQGISKVLKTFREGSFTYLVIEHRLGSDLRSLVAQHGTRSERLTIAWAKQLCEIMIYLHEREQPILHRDLAPDNIVIGEDGRVRLIDFGAARQFIEGLTGTMIGKQCYMAPEQLRGDATRKSDIYSFGCTLSFLLTGRDPVALKPSSPGSESCCSADFDDLIRQCTEFDEALRPDSFSVILEQLKQIERGHTIKLKVAQPEAVA